MLVATGIPPHVQQAELIGKTLNLCIETLEEVKQFAITVKDAVKEAYEDRAEENGQVTGERLKQMLDQYHESMLGLVDQRLADLKNSIQTTAPPQDDNENPNNNDDNGIFAPGEEVEEQGQQEQQQPTRRILYQNSTHDGRFLCHKTINVP